MESSATSEATKPNGCATSSMRLAILGGGRDAWPIIRACDGMGIVAVVVAKNATEVPCVHIRADCYSIDETLNALIDYGAWIDGVMCGGTDATHVAQHIADVFQIDNGMDMFTVDHTRDKIAQYALFTSWGGINIPNWDFIDPSDSVPIKYDSDKVLKPAIGRGSLGVVRVNEGEQVADAYYMARDVDDWVIAMDWVDGVQLSSESIVQDGKVLWTAYSERNYSRLDQLYPFVIEDGGDLPPDIKENVHELDWREQCHEQLQRCVEAIQLRRGTVKGDLVWDGERCWVIEVSPRLSGGGFYDPQIRWAWGVDFAKIAVMLALGKRVNIKPYWMRMDEARWDAMPYFMEYVCQRYNFPLGDRTQTSWQRGACVYGRGATRKSAQQRANKLAEAMHDSISNPLCKDGE